MMGLYLAVFDNNEDELDGLEVGSYADYNYFIDAVVSNVEGGDKGANCPTLVLHHDSDGCWSSNECVILLKELSIIETEMKKLEALPFNSTWMEEVAISENMKPKNMYESFIDVDGEFLIGRLSSLCELAIETGNPIYFQ